MKRKSLFTFWILLLLTKMGCRQAVTDITSEKKAVKAVIDNYAKSWIIEDIELYSSTMMSDESLIHVGGSQGLTG